MRFDEPIWNSPDGRDWTAKYYAARDEAIVPPVAVTPVVVHLERVYTASGPLDAPGDTPRIADGSNLNVLQHIQIEK